MANYVVGMPQDPAAAKCAGVQNGPVLPVQAGLVNHFASSRGTAFVPTLYQYIHDVIDGKRFFDPHAADALLMRVLLAIGAIQIYWREEKRSEAISLLKDLRGMLVDVGEFELCDKRIRSFFEDSIRSLETDPAADALDRIASDDEELSRPVQCIPTMVSAGTLRYYKWLARTLKHPGDIVDLGSWMGASSACLAEGLSENLSRKDRKVHAYDSFVWRDWMRTYTEDPELLAANIRDGDSFLHYFHRYTASFRHLIQAHRSVLRTATEQSPLPALEWSGGPIAILVMDFDHERAANEAMWRVFSPSFQDGTTIVIFNQYGNVPARRGSRFLPEQGERACSAAQTMQFRESVQVPPHCVSHYP